VFSFPRFTRLVRKFAGPIALTAVVLSPAAQAQQLPDELIEEERIRSIVEQAYDLVHTNADSGGKVVENFVRAADDLIAGGDATVPYLTNELTQELHTTFDFTAYALGRLGGPEAAEALREAMRTADLTTDTFSRRRKGWAGYCLGLMGEVESIRLLNTGQLLMGSYPVHGDTGAVEAIAAMNGPAATPIILEEMTRLAGLEAEAEEQLPVLVQRTFLVRALRRSADPAAIPTLIELLNSNDHESIRREAARSLGAFETTRVVDELAAALDDPSDLVRKSAGISLERTRPARHLPAMIARLEIETHPQVRSSLYRIIAARMQEEAVEILRPYLARPDMQDRAFLARALGEIRSDAVVPLLRMLLDSPETIVAGHAIGSLDRVGTAEALRPMLEAASSRRRSLAQLALEQLVARGMLDAAPQLLRRIVDRELVGVLTDPGEIYEVKLLLDLLAGLRPQQAKGLKELLAAGQRQSDGGLRDKVVATATRLEVMRKNGGKVKRWIQAATADDAELRLAAYSRLGELGGEAAARTLAERFGRVDATEGAEILRAAGKIDAAPTRELIERVLLGPEFDSTARRALRDMAAWAALQLGGEKRVSLLEQAIERRDAREVRPLIYLVLLDPVAGRAMIDKHATSRMRYVKWTRGIEQEELARLVRDLDAGRSIERFRRLPPLLVFR